MNILAEIRSFIASLPNTNNIRFEEADYSMAIYNDGYVIDIQMKAEDLFPVLGQFMTKMENKVSVEVYPLDESELRVSIALH